MRAACVHEFTLAKPINGDNVKPAGFDDGIDFLARSLFDAAFSLSRDSNGILGSISRDTKWRSRDRFGRMGRREYAAFESSSSQEILVRRPCVS